MAVYSQLASLALKGAAGRCTGSGLRPGPRPPKRSAVSSATLRRSQPQPGRRPRAGPTAAPGGPSRSPWPAARGGTPASSPWPPATTAPSASRSRPSSTPTRSTASTATAPTSAASASPSCRPPARPACSTAATLDPDELARRVGDLSRFGDPAGRVEAEFATLDEVAADLRRAGLRRPGDVPDAAARRRARRCCSSPCATSSSARSRRTRSCSRAWPTPSWRASAEGQEAGFADLAEALEQHGDRLEALLADVQAVVVADARRRAGHQGRTDAPGPADAGAGPGRPRRRCSSTSSSGASCTAATACRSATRSERRLVRDLVRRYRALPPDAAPADAGAAQRGRQAGGGGRRLRGGRAGLPRGGAAGRRRPAGAGGGGPQRLPRRPGAAGVGRGAGGVAARR